MVRRTSSDLRLHPHLHVVFLDGAHHQQGDALVGEELGYLQTREVGSVLERAVRRIARYLRRHGALEPAGDADEDEAEDADAATDAPERRLVASAVSGQTPPPDRTGSAGSRRSRRARSPTTSRCAPRSVASRCTPRRGPARSTSQGARPSCATCAGRRSRRRDWSCVPMGSCASCSAALRHAASAAPVDPSRSVQQRFECPPRLVQDRAYAQAAPAARGARSPWRPGACQDSCPDKPSREPRGEWLDASLLFDGVEVHGADGHDSCVSSGSSVAACAPWPGCRRRGGARGFPCLGRRAGLRG